MEIFEWISTAICGVWTILNGVITFFARKVSKASNEIKNTNDELQSKLQRAYVVCNECGHQIRIVDTEVHVPPVMPKEEVIKIG